MRLSPIAPADLDAQQKPLFDSMVEGVSAKYADFVTTRDDGALLGPWNAWLHDPALGQAFWAVTQAMTQQRRIPDGARQIAILVTGARFGAAYELYAHAAVAEKKHGMTAQRIATLAAGERPDDLDLDEAVAHDVAKVLLNGGPLPTALYRVSLERFGQSGTNELIYLVGHYCFVSMTLNGFDVPVPGEE